MARLIALFCLASFMLASCAAETRKLLAGGAGKVESI
jgi:hypothetical protein